MRPSILCASLFLPLACAGPALAGLEAGEAERLVRENLIYPSPVYGFVRWPPETPGETRALDDLREAGLVSETREGEPVSAREEEVLVLRGYPDYLVRGLRVRLCEEDVAVSLVERASGGWRVRGHIRPSRPAGEWARGVPPLREDADCRPREAVWHIRKTGRRHEVREVLP